MTREDLILTVSAKTGLDKNLVRTIVQAAISEMGNALARKEEITFRGFGTLSARLRKARSAQNISKRTTILLPERYVPHFKGAKELCAKMNL